MTITCIQWDDCKPVGGGGGCCRIGEGRGRPGFSFCRRCEKWEEADGTRPNKPKPPGLGDCVGAAINIATLGTGHAIAQGIAHAIGVEDCGCEGRKEALNRLGEEMGL